VIVPLVSPFNDDFTIDKESLGCIIESIIEAGAVPFVLGTTGEAQSMSKKQKDTLVESTVLQVAGRCLVYAGISGNCLEESVEDSKRFAGYGVNAVVAHLPYYYPVDQVQTMKYFVELANDSPVPLMIYNIPSTTRFSVPVEVVNHLSFHPNIAGIKDSERSTERMDQSIGKWKERSDFSYFSGWATQSAYALKSGADGIVPSTGNLFPGLYHDLCKAVQADDFQTAGILQERTDMISLLYQKNRALNHSITALKVIMSEMHLCKPWVLPPLYRMEQQEEGNYRCQILSEMKNIVHG
jgi:dihydrodipicolinate synthase/N-acetylneuraminate lyase